MIKLKSKKMLAAVCEKQGSPLSIKSVFIPEPKTNEILVKLETCGVCHSDLHIRDGHEEIMSENLPIILGHEGVGKVVEVGENSSRAWKIGERVGLPWLYETCRECKFCKIGREAYCSAQVARSFDKNGCFAEFAICKSDYAIKIPKFLDPIQAAPKLCAGLTSWSANLRAAVNKNDVCLVIGCGGLGLYAIQIAKSLGASVICLDTNLEKLSIALKYGADHAFLSDLTAPKKIQEVGGADVCINFVPSKSIWPIVEKSLNPMARVVLVALMQETTDLSHMWMINGGYQILGNSVGSRKEMEQFFDFSKHHTIKTPIREIKIKDVNKALDMLLQGKATEKMVITF